MALVFFTDAIILNSSRVTMSVFHLANPLFDSVPLQLDAAHTLTSLWCSDLSNLYLHVLIAHTPTPADREHHIAALPTETRVHAHATSLHNGVCGIVSCSRVCCQIVRPPRPIVSPQCASNVFTNTNYWDKGRRIWVISSTYCNVTLHVQMHVSFQFYVTV